MKERIIEFLKAENKTSAQFAEEIGVQPSGISHILSGRNKPSLDFILKMLEKYRYLSMEWLLFGKGMMYKEQIIMPDLFQQSEKEYHDKGEKENDGKSAAPEERDESETENEEKNTHPSVEKIVWFYNNKSFREYYPEKE